MRGGEDDENIIKIISSDNTLREAYRDACEKQEIEFTFAKLEGKPDVDGVRDFFKQLLAEVNANPDSPASKSVVSLGKLVVKHESLPRILQLSNPKLDKLIELSGGMSGGSVGAQLLPSQGSHGPHIAVAGVVAMVVGVAWVMGGGLVSTAAIIGGSGAVATFGQIGAYMLTGRWRSREVVVGPGPILLQ